MFKLMVINLIFMKQVDLSLKITFLTLSLIALSHSPSAQSIAINTDGSAPNASAMLDVKHNSKGVLIPRTSTTSRVAIINPAKGLLVYDTTAGSFWYHTGSGWKEISSAGSDWSLTGNSGTSMLVNFLGTTDNQPLRLKLNNKWSGELNHISRNYSIGDSAGLATTGTFNVAIGSFALSRNTTGSSNIAIGTETLLLNTDGSRNTGTGMHALFNNRSGNNNSAAGYQSMFSNTVGSNNTALGYQSLYTNSTGHHNIASGFMALYNNSEGYENAAAGAQALSSNTFGHNNSAYGYNALRSNISGNYNTAVGASSLNATTTNQYNTAVGRQALASNPGYENTACGESAGTNNSNQATFLGSLANASAGTNNVMAIGYNAQVTASNMVKVGNTAVTSIGGHVGWTTYPSDVRYKKNIRDAVPGLDFINQLRPVTYNIDVEAIDNTLNMLVPRIANRASVETEETRKAKLEKSKVSYTGFIAQEVEQAARKLNYEFSGLDIPKDGKGVYGIRYAEFVVPLVKAVQELNIQVQSLKIKLADDDLKEMVLEQQKLLQQQQTEIEQLRKTLTEIQKSQTR
jgi:trimeric autotransporter adhesin